MSEPDILTKLAARLGITREQVVAKLTKGITTPDYCWYVQCGNFVCIVDSRDASSESEALREASDPLTRWYFEGASLAGHTTCRRITHNEFCDWLRNGRSYASTIKIGT